MKKVEIIDVELGINIAEEIRKKVDSLDTAIIERTREAVRNTMKIQKSNKKEKLKEDRDAVVLKVVKFLEKAFEQTKSDGEHIWLEGKHLCKAAGLEDLPQNLNKLTMQIRRHLEKEDRWTLTKVRKSRKTLYRLARFE